MSGELDAAGAAATAGLVVGALERKDPASAHAGAAGAACPNCETVLQGRFCHACGQPAHINRSLGHLIWDIVVESMHLDTRAWRTLPLVFFRPGTLTYTYIHGKRTRYVSPLGLFLLSIFALFFVFEVFVTPAFQKPMSTTAVVQHQSTATLQQRVEKAQAKKDAATKALAAAESEAARLRAAGGKDAEADANELLADAKEEASDAETDLQQARATFEAAQKKDAERAAALAEAKEDLKHARIVVAGQAPVASGAVRMAEKTVEVAAQSAAAASATSAEGVAEDGGPDLRVKDGERWQDRLRDEVLAGKFNFNSSYPQLNEKLKQAALNADLAVYKLQQAASHYAFLLIPISLPFIAFMFLWKRGVTLFDHAVFSLYSLSFVAMLTSLIILIEHFGGDAVAPVMGTVFGVGVPMHLYFQFKGAYALGWWSAFWRTVLFCFFAVFTLTAFMLAIFFLGIVT